MKIVDRLKKNRLFYIIFWVIILTLSFLRPAELIYRQRNDFFSPGYAGNYEILRKAYYSSQYVNKINPGIMPDNTFEAFAGGAFIRGVNPILIVHEHPPLGRYIIGLSIILFDNPNTIILPLLLFSIFGIFLIARLSLHNIILSIIPVAIFTNEPLFLSKFEYAPLIESVQLPFIIFSLYFFIKGIIEKNYSRYFILSSMMLGFVISIRFFILGAALAFSMCLYFILRRKIDKKVIIFLLSLPLSLVVLIASYTKTIQEGYSIIQVFGIQKYIFFYHKSKLISFFSFWDLIMFNRWHTWWGDRRILNDYQWIVFWPISMILNGIYLILTMISKTRLNEPEKIIFLWIISYCALLSVGESTTRYFLPLVPFLYILAVSFLIKIFKPILEKL